MSDAAVTRYAEALFELAGDKGLLPEVADGVDGIRKAFSEDSDLVARFRSVRTTKTEMHEIIEQKLAARAHPYVSNTLKLMVDRNRGSNLLGFVLAFFERMERQQEVLKVLVESAQDLNAEQKEDLVSRLAASTGKKIAMEAVTVPELVGGMRLTIGSKRIDASVKKQLDNLESRLRSAV